MSRRQALNILRSPHGPTLQFRKFSITSLNHFPADSSKPVTSTPVPAPPSSSKKPVLSSAPIPITQPPVFPVPSNLFEPPKSDREIPQYSETTKTLVRGVAKLLGYNSPATTAIRESRRMMKGIVEGVERDRVFWYDECNLPPSYQSFFQLHLLYVLILLPRLRVLPATSSINSEPMTETLKPLAPSSTTTSSSSSDKTSPILSKPAYESYVTELLSHFFELAESQMRIVLGRGERERVVKKYMEEMGQQWKGAGVGLDYVLGLSSSEIPEERGRADAELTSWIWRNLFDGRGLIVGNPIQEGGLEVISDGGFGGKRDDLEFVNHLEKIVRFVRREMARLDNISDEDVLRGNIGVWGSPKE